jgi:fucose 4-O-acetylase-like acetyltransferase
MSNIRARWLDWPDLVKGMAMLLVVSGHVLGGLRAGHCISDGRITYWAYNWMYLFHVPALFFVSGWLVEFRTRNSGSPPSLKVLLRSLLYPYFLWGLIIWGVHMAGAGTGLANVHADPWVPFRLLYSASAGPWFLYVLFLFQALNRLLGDFKLRLQWLGLIAFGAFCDYVYFSHEEFDSTRCCFDLNVGFYVLGILTASRGWLEEVNASVKWTLGCGLALLVLLGWAVWWRPALMPWSRLPLGLVGIAGILGVSIGWSGGRTAAWLKILGRHSLAIYVMHGFAPPLTRWLLVRRLGITNAGLLLTVGVLAGLLTSLTAVWLLNRFQLGVAFGLGGSKRSSDRVKLKTANQMETP